MSCSSLQTRFKSVVIVTLPLLVGALHIPVAIATTPQVEVTQLLKTTHSWDGVQYPAYPKGQPEVTVLRYKIPANSALPWHSHPTINVGYVLSGQLTVIRKSDSKSMVIGPGDALPEMVGAPHRGQSGDEAVELIVFYAGTPLVPLTVRSETD
ncbi:cupin domain-containing protein [Pseudomonas sp. Q1]|uniref:cupin domain-containing protein n=1 Tax=Pseudomonas sp. Q1 TaxID=2202823 RepID=UPI0013750C27|nr:cupin domain-containing protein [Pseudomonas sp. Q1]NCE83797.1 cupin [Pseudomonas sp. Q1]